MNRTNIIWRTAGLIALAAALPSSASVVDFTLDTSALAPAAGTWALQFQLTNGDPVSANTVDLSNFNFGGGSAAGGAATSGGASGSLAAGVTLNDTGGFLALFTEEFTPGSTLTFRMDATTNFSGNPPPDFFGLAVLFNGTPIATAHFVDQVIAVSLEDPLIIEVFNSPSPRGPDLLPTPTYTPGGAAVPEPSTLVTVLLPVAWMIRRRLRP